MNHVARLGSLLTMDDFYCGAGGETTGAKKLGIQVRHAFNHDELAIETHNTNHPETTHICADIGEYDPMSYKPSVIGWFSPECQTFSMARGKSQKHLRETPLPGFGFEEFDLTPKEERSRVTAGDILRHVEIHRYELVVVENVVGFREWEKFDSWLQTMLNFGYDYEIVYLNSMFCHPTPQSRDRMYTCFWRKGNRKPNLDIRPLAWCEQCGKDVESKQSPKTTATVPWMKYDEQYTYICPACNSRVEPYYYAAANIIDWTNIGVRIGDRKRPLAENTMARIRFGLKKFGNGIVETAFTNAGEKRVSALYTPLSTQTGQQSKGIFLSPYHQDETNRNRSLDEPMPAVDGSPRFGLVTMPFIVRHYSTSNPGSFIDEALSTVVASGVHHSLINPPSFIAELRRTGQLRSTEEPLSTITAGGNHHALVQPFITTYNGNSVFVTTDEPLPTVTTREHHGFVPYPAVEVEDCYFRMLTTDEIKLAMGFPHDYVLLGNQKQKTKLAGQAVTPEAASVLLQRCAESLA